MVRAQARESAVVTKADVAAEAVLSIVYYVLHTRIEEKDMIAS